MSETLLTEQIGALTVALLLDHSLSFLQVELKLLFNAVHSIIHFVKVRVESSLRLWDLIFATGYLLPDNQQFKLTDCFFKARKESSFFLRGK
jgi:hypothetical protein